MDQSWNQWREKMNYRSLGDLNRCITANLHKIPRDVDLIVGIPRSGLLPANLLALYLELPLTDLDGFLDCHILSNGRTRASAVRFESMEKIHKVLVVDDSVATGETLSRVRKRIAEANIKQEVMYAAIYITPFALDQVDLYLEICPSPRFFQWNILHHAMLERSCVDIDGVLCRDPLIEENDDEERYASFLQNAEPLFIPKVTIGNLVTCRLEKHRLQTEYWLAKNNVTYRELFMMPFETKEERIKSGSHAEFKARIFQETQSQLFIESSSRQARRIALITGKPVFCLETWTLMQTGMENAQNSAEITMVFKRSAREFLYKWLIRPMRYLFHKLIY